MHRAPVVVIGPDRDVHLAAIAARVRDRGAPVISIDASELIAGRGLVIAGDEIQLDGRPLFPACVYLRALGPARTAVVTTALATWRAASIAVYDAPAVTAPAAATAAGDAFVLDDEVIAATGAAATAAGRDRCRRAAAGGDARFSRVVLEVAAGRCTAAVEASPDFLEVGTGADIADHLAARLAGWTRRYPLRRSTPATVPPSLTPRSLLPLARP